MLVSDINKKKRLFLFATLYYIPYKNISQIIKAIKYNSQYVCIPNNVDQKQ